MTAIKLGRYEVIRMVGRGAMGVVYEGRDPNLDRRVAIKTIRIEDFFGEAIEEYEARFRTEARSAARLQHPNIVSVYDSDRDGDTAFMVMELVAGKDLKHHLGNGVRFALKESLDILRQLLSALEYAHGQGIVHRDVKPANLLLEPDGHVKLADFGVARIQGAGVTPGTRGSVVGTLNYMSPEQVRGQPVDVRTDIFAAGVVFYQLLTGRMPFDGESDLAVSQQIVEHTPPAPSSLDAQLPIAIDALVARALAKQSEDRFATAREFSLALQAAGFVGQAGAVDSAAGPNNAFVDRHLKADVAPMAGSARGLTTAPSAALKQRVICDLCSNENPVSSNFCGSCGARLGVACNRCGQLNSPSSRFCGHCGGSLNTTAAPLAAKTQTGQEVDSPTEPERRQITVMFCDLVGSTTLSHELDPEDLRSAVLSYQDVVSESVSQFDGHIAQYLGDGVLVYFGYPRAHEDDARRAVNAGLRIVSALPSLNRRLCSGDAGLGRLALRVRVGIHTGLVVAGEIGTNAKRDQLAIGETPNLAAHLQSLAQPNTVLVSKSTYRLVNRHFDLVGLGSRPVKGLAQTIEVYEARGEKALDATGATFEANAALAPVGREREIVLLRERWQQVEQGGGHVLLVSGEAGIGKTRLARTLVEYTQARPHTLLEARFSPYHQHSPFHPVAGLLQQMTGVGKDASMAVRRAGLDSLLTRYKVPAADALSAMGSFLGIDPDDAGSTRPASPDQQRQTVLESLLGILVGMAADCPVLLVCEDLHWADPSTLELLRLLVGQVPAARIFVLLTARPTFVQPWPARSYATQLSLEPFTQAQTELMVSMLTGGKSLPAEVLKQVIAKTDGVPLFAEELVKFVLESGLLRQEGEQYQLVGELPEMAIPSTLQDSLMARLDRLAPLKSLVQLAATVGREFSYALLRAIRPMDDATLRSQLAGLVEAELIFQRGLPPRATYVFKHALIQDAAYQSLLKSARREYHRRIAEVMSQSFADTVTQQPEVLAHHYTQARQVDKAIESWKRAGEYSLQRSAYPEAISHISQALALVPDLPDGAARATWELDLQVALAPALDATKGVSSPEVKAAYGRAWELCQALGKSPQAFQILMGLRRYYFVHGDLATAHSVAEQLLAISQESKKPHHLVETHLGFGVVCLWRGELKDALVHLNLGIKHLTSGTSLAQETVRLSSVSDPVVNCLAVASWALWISGSIQASLARSRQSVEYARRLDHPISIALALDYAAALREFRGETNEALELAEEGIALCRRHGLKFWLGLLMVRRGWALSRIGTVAEGLAETRAGIDIWNGTGAKLARPFLYTLLAETLARAEHFDEAKTSLDEALDDGLARGERFYEAEVHRLSGDLLQQRGQQMEGEKSLLRALDIARRQGAHSLALRAATSIARYWSKCGKSPPAKDLLSETCAQFADKCDSLDVIHARKLLEYIEAGIIES
jgi:serine/threonine protein kinase/class 3 adenylate cyclase/tetratricopeptide (TPR) repeat protein